MIQGIVRILFWLRHYYMSQDLNKSILLPADVSKNCWMSDKQCRHWSDTTFCGIWSSSTLLAQGLSAPIHRVDKVHYILNLKAPSKVFSRRHSKILFFYYFSEKIVITFDVNCLLGRWYTRNAKTCFLWKIKTVIFCSCDWRFKS